MIVQGPGITRDQLDEYSTTLQLHAVDLTIPRLKTHPLYVMETLPWRNSYEQAFTVGWGSNPTRR
jgi:hypothetical protein